MVLKVLLDVNICLDVLLDRKPFVSYSGRIFEAVEKGDVEGVISGISFNTLFYIMRPAMDRKKAIENLRLLLVHFIVGTVGSDTVEHAIRADWKDLKDALRYYCTAFSGCDYVITRNVSDFEPSSSTKILSPKDFIDKHIS